MACLLTYLVLDGGSQLGLLELLAGMFIHALSLGLELFLTTWWQDSAAASC